MASYGARYHSDLTINGSRWIDSRSMVETFWNSMQIRRIASFKLASELKALQNKIKKWTKEFGDKLEESTRPYISELAKLDMREMEGPLCVGDRDRRDVVRKGVAYNMNLETISCRQKAKEKWLKKGDHNTKYFHCFANYRRKCNYLEEININSVVIRGNSEIRDKGKDYFQQLYEENERCRPMLHNLDFKQIRANSREGIEKRFTEEEVVGCVMDYNGGKALGPDRFNTKFVQAF
ncbi:uncharacterized protein LOC110811491 [Carica papaya]|uniref:uncharacterized protein LOC110811491 n=1 Tax=Carica papaya TaxID=3649 RepID=UPI000B8C6FF1|nr:uncharacterized protein LOC110811491 [Carica papaya]